MGRSKNQVPERWEIYKPLGIRIPGTRFVCSKCPLKEEICKKLPTKSQWFTPECLFRMLQNEQLELGLIIDLTNTDKYYNPMCFTYCGIEYTKIYIPGHDVPEPSSTEIFKDIVKQFEKKHPNSNSVIVVHCTHGINRTGYQICHYLIESCGWSCEKAIQTFNLARGHSIERENYLLALQELESRVATAAKKKRKGRRNVEKTIVNRRGRSASSSSVSSVDSLFKPANEKIKATPETKGSSSGTLASLQTPVFNPALVQQMWANVSQMRAAMSNMMLKARTAMPSFLPSMQGRFPVMAPAPVLPTPALNYAAMSTRADFTAAMSDELSSSSSSSLSEESKDGASSQNEEETEPALEMETETDQMDPQETVSEEQDNVEFKPDWSLGGKVQVAPKKTYAQKRRERQKRLAQMHKTLQSGNFYKIREMQKEKYGF